MFRLVLISCFSMLAFVRPEAGEISISGSYTGEDVYIRNPFNPEKGEFCILSVSLNGVTVLTAPQASAVRVDLSGMSRGERVNLRVDHRDGCSPQFINPQVLEDQNWEFSFLSTLATNNSIEWATQGEKTIGKFIIQRRMTRNDLTTYWLDEMEVEAKGRMKLNRYAIEPDHWLGEENIYRIRYEPIEQNPVFSEEIRYTSTLSPVTFFPKSVTTQITFSDRTYYEIYDMNGRMILSGTDDEVWLQDLKPGEYMVKIQNRFEKFVKK